MRKVSELNLRQQGLLADTAFLLLAPTGIPRPNRSTDVDGRRFHLIPLPHPPAAGESNGAEGGVAVEPEAVFHGWRNDRRECLPGGTKLSNRSDSGGC